MSLAIIKNYISNPSNISDVARELTAKATALPDDDDVTAAVEELFNSFISVARDIPSDSNGQDRLVQLLKVIKNTPGRPITVWSETVKLWSDLPMFGALMRDEWNFAEDATADQSVIITQREQWKNVNAFAARLTNNEVLDLELFAIWTLREALEDVAEPSNPLSVAVPAAAQWIFHAGNHIYKSETEFPHGGKLGDPARGGRLWDGKRGFSKDRWSLWRSRFGEVAKKSELEEDVKAVATKATTVMKEIEQKEN